MEEIKNLFIKYFGFLPDIISTTEHTYISPPSRIISSLTELSRLLNKKVLRIIITDTYSINPENYIKQICLPHVLNKKLFAINNIKSQKELVGIFEENEKKFEDILNSKKIFSPEEEKNYNKLIALYGKLFRDIRNINPVNIYNEIVKMYANDLRLTNLSEWLENSQLFGIDSIEVKNFLKETLDILCKNNLENINSFGKYLEVKKRLKVKNLDGIIQSIGWSRYLKEIQDTSNSYFIPFEIILYIYSYCNGSHFGNDYGMVNDINKIRGNSNLLQITKHNKDYSFKIEKKDVRFQKINTAQNTFDLSHRTYKTVDSLPELYIILGQDNLKKEFKK